MTGNTVSWSRFRYEDGQTGWFDLRIMPIPEGIFVISTDITDKKGKSMMENAKR